VEKGINIKISKLVRKSAKYFKIISKVRVKYSRRLLPLLSHFYFQVLEMVSTGNGTKSHFSHSRFYYRLIKTQTFLTLKTIDTALIFFSKMFFYLKLSTRLKIVFSLKNDINIGSMYN
jgi:hypothetical protein